VIALVATVTDFSGIAIIAIADRFVGNLSAGAKDTGIIAAGFQFDA